MRTGFASTDTADGLPLPGGAASGSGMGTIISMSRAATAIISTPPGMARLDRMIASGPRVSLTFRNASRVVAAMNFLTFIPCLR